MPAAILNLRLAREYSARSREKSSFEARLEERVNERRNGRTAEQDEQAHKEQYNQYREQPPLFIVFEEEPELREQWCSFFLC